MKTVSNGRLDRFICVLIDKQQLLVCETFRINPSTNRSITKQSSKQTTNMSSTNSNTLCRCDEPGDTTSAQLEAVLVAESFLVIPGGQDSACPLVDSAEVLNATHRQWWIRRLRRASTQARRTDQLVLFAGLLERLEREAGKAVEYVMVLDCSNADLAITMRCS